MLATDRKGQTVYPDAEPGKIRSRDKVEDSIVRFLQSIDSPQDLPLKEIKKMWETDETISACLEFTILSIMNHMGEYKFDKSPTIQKFVRNNLNGMRKSWDKVKWESGHCMVYGFSVGEIVTKWGPIKRGRQTILLDNILFLDQLDTDFEKWDDPNSPNYRQVKNVIQFPSGAGVMQNSKERIEIPAEKCLILSHNNTNDRPIGVSRLVPAWKLYYAKEILLNSWCLGLQRFGNPLFAAYVTNPTGKNEDGVTNLEAYAQKIHQLKLGGHIAIPINGDEPKLQDRVEPIVIDLGDTQKEAQEFLNKGIQRALLMPSVIFDPAVGGGVASLRQWDTFTRFVESVTRDLAHAYIQQIVRPLIFWNFGEQEDYGRFEIKFLDETKTNLWSKTVFALVQAAFLNPHHLPDLNFIRDIFGLDPVSEVFSDMPLPGGNPGELPAGQASEGDEKATDNNPESGPKVPATKQGRPTKKKLAEVSAFISDALAHDNAEEILEHFVLSICERMAA